MMKCEFEERFGREVSPEDYKKIEEVYIWLDDITKDDIANLFKTHSQLILNVLYPAVLSNVHLRQRNASLEYANAKLEHLNTENPVLREDNNNLRIENETLLVENNTYRRMLEFNTAYTEELETQLHQYKITFGAIAEMVGSI